MVVFEHYTKFENSSELIKHSGPPAMTTNNQSFEVAPHPQPWCGQHLATGESSQRNIYNYTNVNGKQKTPMCRIAELARYHKLKHEYKLLDESGPAHKKLFTVELILTEEEKYIGSGASIKKAQQAAASVALENTSLTIPPERSNKRKKEPSPVDLLQRLLKRMDFPEPSYITVPLPRLPRTRLQGPFPPPPSGTPAFPQPTFSDAPPVGPSFFPPFMRRNPNSVMPYGAFVPPFPRRVSPFEAFDRLCAVNLSIAQCGQYFHGIGPTLQHAKNDAATQALNYFGPALQNLEAKHKEVTSANNNLENIQNGMANMQCSEPSVDSTEEAQQKQKSVISQVHECAHQMKLNVEFEVVLEDGPPHEKNFFVRCCLRDQNHEVVVEETGEGRKKKEATQEACLKALSRLKPQIETSPVLLASSLFKAQKKNPTSKEGKRKTIIKDKKMDPEYGHQINPVTRLVQVLHTRSEAAPLFTLISENGLSRFKEFTVEVKCTERICQGTGPNKRLAKRAAAEAMLTELGYTKPLPPPGKSLLKRREPELSISTFDPSDLKESQISPPSNNNVNFSPEVQPETKKQDTTEEVTPPTTDQNNTSPSGSSPGTKRRVTFSNQVEACPPPEDANYPQAEVAPLKADVVVEGKLRRIRKSKEGKRALTDEEKKTITTESKQFIHEFCSMITSTGEGTIERDDDSAKLKLDEFSDRFKFSVQYTNFPKSHDNNDYFALVSLGLDQPKVSSGSGISQEAAVNNAAYNAICSLSKMEEPNPPAQLQAEPLNLTPLN